MTPVAMSPIDWQNGSYSFCYNPVVAGPYLIKITFNGIDIDSGSPPQRFQVVHAPADPANTFTIWGELPECFNTAGYCVGPPTGVFVARFTRFGDHTPFANAPLTWGKVFDFSQTTLPVGPVYDGGLNEFVSYVNTVATTDYLAIATSGDFTAAMATNVRTAANAVKPAPVAMKAFQAGDTFGFIGSQATMLVNSSCGAAPVSLCEQRTQSGTAFVSARGIDTSNPAPLTRRFTITARSANQGCGPYARINGVYDDIRLPAGSQNIFSIVAKDKYGNLCDDAEASLAPPLWNPDFTIQAGNRPPGTLTGPIQAYSRLGYYQYQFLSYRAGTYQVNIYLYGQNVNGSYYTVVVTPGLANVTTSAGSGPSLTTAIAGMNATFTLNLADKVNNTINFNNTQDKINGTVYRMDSTGNIVEKIPILLEWTNDPVSGCLGCILTATYNATVATSPGVSYKMDFYMNGQTATYALPNVVPGPLYPANCIVDMSALPQYNPAGTPIQFTIQAKDRFNNNRTIPNGAGETFVIATNVTQSGVVSVAYAGSGGIYNVNLKPKIKGPLVLNITAVLAGINPANPLPAGTYVVQTKTVNIVPGPADPYWSYLQNIPATRIAGLFWNYNILSYDEYGNFRDNQPFLQSVANATDYLFVRTSLRLEMLIQWLSSLLDLPSIISQETTQFNQTRLWLDRIRLPFKLVLLPSFLQMSLAR